MKIKIYVDWRHEEVLNEKDYKEFRDRKVNEIADDYFEDEYEFNCFLEHDYRPAEIFNLDNEAKEEIKEIWKRQCKASAEETFDDDYEYEEVEVEV